MSDNIFFNIADLKSCGVNVIIGKTVRIRYPELVEIGDNVIIDDFCYISTSLSISSNVHISSGCRLLVVNLRQLFLENSALFLQM